MKFLLLACLNMYPINHLQFLRISANRVSRLASVRCGLLLLLLIPSLAQAMVEVDLFDIKLNVADESADTRKEAFKRGLGLVLIKVSGDRQVLNKLTLPSASSYVQQYRYIALSSSDTVSQTSKKSRASSHLLSVTYNASKVIKLLSSNDIAVWRSHRDELVVWLAVRDGKNEYILKGKDVSLIKTEADRTFRQRGVPVIWPKYDGEDKMRLSFSDIKGGFVGPVKAASQRYSTGPVVSMSMSWNGASWSIDAALLSDSGDRRWHYSGKSYNKILAQAIDQVVDDVAARNVVRHDRVVSRQEYVLVGFDNVDAVDDYRKIQGILDKLTVVESALLFQLEPGRVTFKLKLRSGVNEFQRQISNTGKFRQITASFGSVNESSISNLSAEVYRYRFLN